jgi:hypothetical protein
MKPVVRALIISIFTTFAHEEYCNDNFGLVLTFLAQGLGLTKLKHMRLLSSKSEIQYA